MIKIGDKIVINPTIIFPENHRDKGIQAVYVNSHIRLLTANKYTIFTVTGLVNAYHSPCILVKVTPTPKEYICSAYYMEHFIKLIKSIEDD